MSAYTLADPHSIFFSDADTVFFGSILTRRYHSSLYMLKFVNVLVSYYVCVAFDSYTTSHTKLGEWGSALPKSISKVQLGLPPLERPFKENTMQFVEQVCNLISPSSSALARSTPSNCDWLRATQVKFEYSHRHSVCYHMVLGGYTSYDCMGAL